MTRPPSEEDARRGARAPKRPQDGRDGTPALSSAATPAAPAASGNPAQATRGASAAPSGAPDELLILPVRRLVLFPGVVLPLPVKRVRTLATIEAATRAERPVGILLQKDPEAEDPAPSELHEVGTVAVILRYVEAEDGSRLAVCQGQQRFRLRQFVSESVPLRARVELLEEPEQGDPGDKVEALFTALKRQGLEALALMPGAPPQVGQLIEGAAAPGPLADLLATFMDLPPAEKQQVLEALRLEARLRLVAEKLGHLLAVLRMSKDIQQRTEATLGKAQRDYYLRQQLETIRRELGEVDDPQEAEIKAIEAALARAKLPDEARKEATRELERLRRMPPSAAEAAMIRTWLDILVDLPWGKVSEDVLDLERASRILDRDHHGLEPVKRRILEYLAVKKLKPDRKGPILCLVGPPGVGKTSLGQSIARAMGRKFVRMSLGGVHDESEIRGHRRTYIGAMPGKVLDALRKAGTANPVFMLDEIDKLGVGAHGDPSAALLEVLDPAQNDTFRDSYLNVPFDLSRVLFIATANVPDLIPGPLRDRCEMIYIPGYTEEEKLAIARRYLVPRQLEESGLTRKHLRLPDALLRQVITHWTREAGVRGLERAIGAIARHVAARVARGEKAGPRGFSIAADDLRGILGPQVHQPEVALRTAVPGVATGMAWTPFGGELLFIEASATPGGGRLILTGQLGDVMRESAQAALSLVKARAGGLGLDASVLGERDLHIHVPAGAIPKDGPSAGVALFVALVSLLSGRSVRGDVSMTGEISLRGLVLPVGGIRDKVLAAYVAGIRRVLLPARNRDDFEEIQASVRKRIEPIWLDTVDDALRAALPDLAKSLRARSSKPRAKPATKQRR